MNRETLITDLTERNQHFYFQNAVSPSSIALDADIIIDRLKACDRKKGIREGDFLQFANGKIARVAHHHGDCIQPTTGDAIFRGGASSFYLDYGYLDHSGGLESAIPIGRFEATTETMMGEVWIFHQNKMGGGRAVRAMVPLRVFRVLDK